MIFQGRRGVAGHSKLKRAGPMGWFTSSENVNHKTFRDSTKRAFRNMLTFKKIAFCKNKKLIHKV